VFFDEIPFGHTTSTPSWSLQMVVCDWGFRSIPPSNVERVDERGAQADCSRTSPERVSTCSKGRE
jgi:hypothetical protein